MRALVCILALLTTQCSCGDEEPPPPAPPEDRDTGETRHDVAPERVLEVSLDADVGGTATLTQGARLHVLAGSGPAGSRVTLRLVPPDSTVGLPPLGAAAHVGPTLDIDADPATTGPWYVEIPVDATDLPGGLGPGSVHGALATDGDWVEKPCLILQESGEPLRLIVQLDAPGRLDVLADASRTTPVVGSLPISLLTVMPAVLGPGRPEPFVGEVDASAGESPEPLYALDVRAGRVTMESGTWDLLETKDREKKGGQSRLLAVRNVDGHFATSPELIAAVALAHELRTRLESADRDLLARMLEDDAAFLELSLHGNADARALDPVIDLAVDRKVGIPGSSGAGAEVLAGWQALLDDEETRTGVEDALLTLEIQRTRLVCTHLADRIRGTAPADLSGDELLAIWNELDWIASRLDRLGPTGGEPGDGAQPSLLGQWHSAEEILALLADAQDMKKAAAVSSPTDGIETDDQGDSDYDPLVEAVSSIEDRVEGVVGLVIASKYLLPAVAALVSPSGPADWMCVDAIRAEALEIAARPVKMAPPPDTGIKKHNFKKGFLYVVPEGEDEDGRVSGYRWWIDDVKDQHLIKGKATVKARLSELKSGSHDLFVAAVDDDDQRDPEPARLSFYMRRSVDIRTQGLHVDFDAEPWNVNSEHARSVRTFVKSLEGPVQDCTDWHYRWGIDSGGKVTVSWKFSADKTANVAHSVDIIKDTFKNKELAACVEKAMKKPRMRYGQDYRPAADVTVTFHMKPFILFFDSASLAGKPGRDVVGAALYQKCTSKAVRKAESTCDRAVQALPGPWDQASKIAAAKAAAGIGEPLLDSGGPDPDAASDATGIPDATATPTPPDIPEDVSVPELDIVPFPEFDPIEVHGQCIEQQIEITLENCMLHLPKKKLWCVDSCLKKAHTCAKKCTGAMDWGEDPYMCKESCWADDAFSCAEHCAIRDTPFEKDEDIVDW